MINKYNKKRRACIAAELDIIVKKEKEIAKQTNKTYFSRERTNKNKQKEKIIGSYHRFKLTNL
jgi:hypothetical protein